MNENQNSEDIKIVYAYIGYSDGMGEKDRRSKAFYPELPEHILIYFTSILPVIGLLENFVDHDRVQIHNWCYGKKMTRQEVAAFTDALGDIAGKEAILHKLEDIGDDVPFMLVVEDSNNYTGESSNTYLEKQFGSKTVEDCLQFEQPVPMCDSRFPVHEPDMELGYVRGVFTGGDTPFFAKLWRSRLSGLKYVTIVSSFSYAGESIDPVCQEDNEVVSVLVKSGLTVIKPLQDSYELSGTIQYLGRHGIFRYVPDNPVLQYSCYLCRDREDNELLAYTTAVTELYEDEPLKTICNLAFMTHDGNKRAIDLLKEKVGRLRDKEGYRERFQIVKEAIDQWDIMGLDMTDEYDIESDKITSVITENSSVEEIAEAISHVFSLMFWVRGNAPEHCIWPAKLIKEEIDEKYFGVVDQSGRQKVSNDKVNRFFLSGDRIYYTNQNDGDSIYSIHLDGTGRQKLNDEDSWILTLQDNWLYYQNFYKGDRIYRIRTDGTGRQKINDDESGFLRMVDGWIYYHTYNEKHGNRGEGIFRVRADGSERQMVCDGNIFYEVDGVWLYYRNDSRNESHRGLYKVRVDGSEKSRLSSQNPFLLEVHDGWLYYENREDDEKLYRMQVDDGTEQKLADFKVSDLSFVDGWLYCLERIKIENYWPERSKIYRMRPDGSDLRLLIDVYCENYTIDAASGLIYFSNGDDDRTLYRMRMDGTGVKKLNEDISSHIRIDGDWIYYLKGKEGYPKIYRIPLEGIPFDDERGSD